MHFATPLALPTVPGLELALLDESAPVRQQANHQFIRACHLFVIQLQIIAVVPVAAAMLRLQLAFLGSDLPQ